MSDADGGGANPRFGHLSEPSAAALLMRPEAAPVGGLSIGDLLSALWRRKIVAGIAALAVAGAVYAATQRITPLYEAQANLEVSRSRRTVDYSTRSDADRIDYSLLNTQRDRLIATPVLARVLEDAEFAKGPAYANGDRIAALRKRIHIDTSRDSWIIEASLRDEDPQRAKRGLEGLLAAYFARQRDSEGESSANAISFLAQQVERARTRFDQARDQEEAYRREHGILEMDGENSEFARRLRELNLARTELDRHLSNREALFGQVEEADAIPDESARISALLRIESIGSHPLVVEQQKLLFAEEEEASKLAQKFGPKHPRMREKSEEIASTRRHLAEAIDTTRATIASGVEELKLQSTDLDRRIAEAQQGLETYRGELIALHTLSHETAIRERMVEDLRRRLAEEEVTSRQDVHQLVVNNPPAVGSRPINILPALFAASAAVLGLVAAVVAALLAEALDRRVRGVEHAHELSGLPLLARIPKVARMAPLGPGAVESSPGLAEAFRGLRVAMHMACRRRDAAAGHGLCLVVTSPGMGEGKSSIACRLSASLAAGGEKVLLIDADLRVPSQHRQLLIEPRSSLCLLLHGEPQHAEATGLTNFDVLFAGQRPSNAAELLHSPLLSSLVADSRELYDWIIFDTPPVSLVSDALVIGEVADAVLLVLRDHRTRRGALREALRRLQPLRRKMLGFVMNGSLRQRGDSYYGPDTTLESSTHPTAPPTGPVIGRPVPAPAQTQTPTPAKAS